VELSVCRLEGQKGMDFSLLGLSFAGEGALSLYRVLSDNMLYEKECVLSIL
jgi:hypothetical protein